MERIGKTIQIACSHGEITSKARDEELALLVFHLYQMEVRRWISEGKPNVEAGLKALRSMLGIVMAGFGSPRIARTQGDGKAEASTKKHKKPASGRRSAPAAT